MTGVCQSDFNSFYRQHFAAFVAKAFSVVHPGKQYVHAWHVYAMCEAMDETLFGDVSSRRLVISVPPRHLKSFTAAVALPAFLLGHRPDSRIMVATYALELGREHATLCRTLMSSPWYRALFPATRLGRCNGDHLRTIRGGDRMTVSVAGTVTGFAADLIVIDDLLNASDATSPTERLRAQDFIDNALLTRFDDPKAGCVIAIQQRLHEVDPTGYLLGKGYRHLNLPAIAPEAGRFPIGMGRYHLRKVGEALFPEVHDLAALEQIRRELGSTVFNMQYQQDPVAAGGSPMRWEWFRVHDSQMPRNWYQFVVQSWDTAMSADPRADFSVCTTWGFREGIWYLLDVFRDRLDFAPLKRKAVELCLKWQADRVVVEDAGSGKPLLQDVRDDYPDIRDRFKRGWSPEPKDVRFIAVQTMAEAGQMSLPRDAPWLKLFRDELMGFPQAQYDDQVDSVSQFCEWSRLPRTKGIILREAQSRTVKRKTRW